MCTFLPRKSTHKGVLLMEALIALLLFMSMSTIIGSYWHYLSSIRGNTQTRLEGLSIAQNAAHALMIHHEHIHTKNVQYEYAPVSIQSDLELLLPSISLVTIQVAAAHNKPINLKTFYGE